jgi:thiol-disulfide isomerase/thioredoxin
MKKTYLLIFFISLLSCSKAKKEEIVASGKFYPNVESRTVIIGKIKNIQEFAKASKTIRLSVDDITIDKQLKFITTIDEEGNFLFDIPLKHPTNTYLGYSDGRITPYIYPNDTLTITFEIRKVGSLIDINATSYDKKHHQFQIQFAKQNNWIYKQLNNFKKGLSKNKTAYQFKNEIINFEKLLSKKIANRIENKKTDSIIYNYLHYTNTYTCYKDILRRGKNIKNIDKKKLYYSFLNDSIVFNKSALVTSAYRTFLNHYSQYVEPKNPVKILSNGKSDEQKKKELFAKTIEYKTQLRTGIWKDYLVASNIRNRVIKREEELTASSIDYYFEFIKNNIDDTYTKQLLTAMLDEVNLNIIERDKANIPVGSEPQNITTSSEENLYEKILKINKGKVIYIDFWGTWCSPCIQQFPFAKKLHSKLKSKKVAFVYLSCQSKKEASENVIKKYQLEGQHYLLNQKQYEFFEKKFNIVGLPRYVIIDKNGKVYNKNATKPESGNTLSTLEKLLEAK